MVSILADLQLHKSNAQKGRINLVCLGINISKITIAIQASVEIKILKPMRSLKVLPVFYDLTRSDRVERWQSGRMCPTRNRVCRKVPRVRIPPLRHRNLIVGFRLIK